MGWEVLGRVPKTTRERPGPHMQHPCSPPGVTWETQTRPPDTVHPARGDLLELAVLLAGRVTGHDLQPIRGPASLRPLCPRGQAQTCARSRAQKCSRQPWLHALEGPPTGLAGQRLLRPMPQTRSEGGAACRRRVGRPRRPQAALPMPVKFGKGIYHDRSQKPGLFGG